MAASRLLPGLFHGINRLHGEMDRLFDGWTVELPHRGAVLPAYPALNVSEDADAYYVEADLPGLARENLNIDVSHRNQVTISGERAAEEQPKTRWHRRERGFGKFQRVLKLPATIDAEKVSATLEGGVLLLTLPKAEDAKPRRIAVTSA